MKNIFLVYIPPGNAEAMVHYEDTIRQKVNPERIYRHVGTDSSLPLDPDFRGTAYRRVGLTG